MPRVSRRTFAKTAAAALAAPMVLRAENRADKLRVAIIGVGGRGQANLGGIKSEEIAVLCDVNADAVEKTATRHPEAKKFSDFRKVFDKPADFDAVVVSTCEHTHYHATMLALKHKKHVYCEKPLTHNVWEARQIREAASTAGVATQMGIQIHATDNFRRVVELIRAGAIGPVREAHVWVSRAWGLQSEDAAKKYKDIVTVRERPTDAAAPPSGLDWDLWLGPAPARPFHPVYVPGPKWYRWWDFGNGTMSDLGSHRIDLAFWALDLKAPLTVQAFGPPPHAELAPASMRVEYKYGPRGEQPAVKVVWYQGEEKPPHYRDGGIPKWNDGALFVGDNGMLLSDYFKHVLLPEKAFAGYQGPDPTIPRVKDHYVEWIAACKGQGKALADFEYSGWLTEANHLGNVAHRVGKEIVWNAANLTCENAPEASKYLRREYRKGWDA